MANLTSKRLLEWVGEVDEISPRCTNSTTFYKGGLLTFNSSGFADKPTDASSQYVAGIFAGQTEGGCRDDAFVTLSGENPRIRLLRGMVWLPFSGATQSNVGEIFFIEDDQTITKTAGTRNVKLIAIDFKPGFLLFDIRNAL
jgi:hypothetical protein